MDFKAEPVGGAGEAGVDVFAEEAVVTAEEAVVTAFCTRDIM